MMKQFRLYDGDRPAAGEMLMQRASPSEPAYLALDAGK